MTEHHSDDSELSPGELQDLAVAAIAQNNAEAAALELELEEAGIPVCTRGGISFMGLPEPQKIFVPRKLLPAATEIIQKFRGENASNKSPERPVDLKQLQRQVNEGVGLIALGVALFVASFLLTETQTRITLIFGVPTILTGLFVVLAARHKLRQRRKN